MHCQTIHALVKVYIGDKSDFKRPSAYISIIDDSFRSIAFNLIK